MKKICLLLAFVLFCCSLTGCDDPEGEKYRLLDADKAAEVALSYMNEKYDEEFYVVKSEADAKHGYVPGSIQDSWVDVTVAIVEDESVDESEEEYTVQLRLNADKENYDISWDNYMVTLVVPCLKNKINEALSEINSGDFLLHIFSLSEMAVMPNGFTKDYPIPQKKCTLRAISDSACLYFYCDITLPESAYCSDCSHIIREALGGCFFDDSICFIITTYPDDIYSELSEVINTGKESDVDFNLHYTEQERFYLRTHCQSKCNTYSKKT